MIPKDLKPEWIREFHRIGTELSDVDIRIPSEVEQQAAKEIIEKILPPDDVTRHVYSLYVKFVLIGYEYARTHYRGTSMLDDIKEGKNPEVSDYNLRR